MRILFLTNLPSPYRVKFFSELGRLCELTVVYEREKAGDRESAWYAAAEKTYDEIFLHSLEIGNDNSLSFEILKYLSEDYDMIVVGMYSTYTAMIAMAWMRLKRIDYCISTDGGFAKKEFKLKEWIKKKCISSAKFWMGTGKLAREYLAHYGADEKRIYDYPFTSLDQTEVLKRVCDTKEKSEIRKRLDITGKYVVISVGQFIHRKGLDVLVEAFKLLDDNEIELLIIGGTREKFKNAVSEDIPDRVRVIDFMPKEELLEFYKAADIFVLPTREDVWGLVVNEAMACGLPVITTEKCGAGIELVENGVNGYIVPVEDSLAITVATRKILSDSEVTRYGENSLSKIKDYTFQNMAIVCRDILTKNRRMSK